VGVMNTLIKSVSLVTTVGSLSALAAVSVSDTNSASFNFSGTIEPVCKVKGSDSNGATAMVIDQNNTTQDIGSLEVWCNTGRTATTNYSSANKGFLVDGSNQIAYTLSVGDGSAAIDLAGGYTDANTETGSDSNGTGKTSALKITPQSNGLDAAGQYSDTITVTVSYN
jgi:spore coat protein U-like protein